MSTIFISYRREDSQDIAGRLYDRIERHFGASHVFFDVDDIPIGVDFRDHLSKAVGRCQILLAVIGDNWLDSRYDTPRKQGQRRLDDPADFVRIEIESAIRRNLTVVPVLVGGATMPREESLPSSLKELAFRNAIEIRSGPQFRGDTDRLIRGLQSLLPKRDRKTPATSQDKAGTKPSAARGDRRRRNEPQKSAKVTAAPDEQASPFTELFRQLRRVVGHSKRRWLWVGSSAVVLASLCAVILLTTGNDPDNAGRGGRELAAQLGVGDQGASPDQQGTADGTVDRTNESGDAPTAPHAMTSPRLESETAVATSGAVTMTADTRRSETREAGRPAVRSSDADPDSGGNRRTLRGHTGEVTSISCSPDGTAIVSGAADKTVRLWDTERGTPRWEVNVDGEVWGIRFTPDGQRILAVSKKFDGTGAVEVLDATSGIEIARFIGHTNLVYSVCAASDGIHAASTSLDGSVRVWVIESGSETQELQLGRCRPVAFSNDMQWLIGGSYPSLTFGHLPSAKHVASLTLPYDGTGYSIIAGLSIAPDGSAMACSLARPIYAFDLDQIMQRLTEAVAHQEPSGVVLIAHDGPEALWSVDTWELVPNIDKNSGPLVSHLDYSPSGEHIAATIAKTNLVLILDSRTGRVVDRILPEGDKAIVNSVFLKNQPYSAEFFDDNRVVFGRKDGVIEIVSIGDDVL